MGIFDRNPEGGAIQSPLVVSSGGGGGSFTWATPIDSNITVDADSLYALGALGGALDIVYAGYLTSSDGIHEISLDGSISFATNNGITLNDSSGSNGIVLNPAADIKIQTQSGSATALKFYDDGNAGYVAFKGASSISLDVIWTLPDADGTSGQVLTTDGAGILSWAGVSGATTELDNLGVTAINASLLFDADATYDVGSISANLNGIHVQTINSTDDLSVSITGATTIDSTGDINIQNSGIGNLSLNGSQDSILTSQNGNTTVESLNGDINILAANGAINTNASILFNTADTYDLGSNTSAAANVYTNFVRSPNSLGLTSGANLEITMGNDAIYLYATAVAPSMYFYDDTTSFAVGVKAPGTLVADTLFQFPPTNGASGQFLQTDGTGVSSWATASTFDPSLSSNDFLPDSQLRLTSVEASAFWGGAIDGVVFDSTAICTLGNANEYAFMFTSDRSTGKTANLQLMTGDATVSGNAGAIFLQCGTSTAAAGGVIQLQAGNGVTSGGGLQLLGGNASAGNSQDILIQTGTASGVRGSVTMDALSYVFSELGKIGLNTENQTSWGSDIPGLIFSDTDSVVAAASGGGLFFNGNGSQSLAILTSDKASSNSSSTIYAGTGYTDSGTSGAVDLFTGGSVTGNTGLINLLTGNSSSAGATGNINLSTGTTSGTRGKVVISARTLGLPSAAADPSGGGAGEIYYNTSISKIKMFNGTTWEAVTSL